MCLATYFNTTNSRLEGLQSAKNDNIGSQAKINQKYTKVLDAIWKSMS